MDRFLFLFYYYFIFFKEGGDCYVFFETELSLTKQPLYLRPGRSEYSLLMKLLLIQIRKSLNKNDWDQVLWACKTELPIQTLVFTNTAGHHNLVKVIVIYGFPLNTLLNLNSFRNFEAQSIRKHMWHMIFLTFLHNWCNKNSMYLSTGLFVLTVNISWNFKERIVHKLPFFLGFSVAVANSCRGSLQKKDSLLFIFGCKGFLKCNYFRNWCIIYSGGNSFRNSHAFLTTR